MKGFIRPNFIIMPESSVVPNENFITPPPDQFTHVLIRTEPFYFTGPQQAGQPDGELAKDSRVVLLVHDGGSYCRVADERGLYVVVGYASLKQI